MALRVISICCYFFSKGDHDGAIKQYIKTIGHLEPSYVIRKVQCALPSPVRKELLKAVFYSRVDDQVDNPELVGIMMKQKKKPPK